MNALIRLAWFCLIGGATTLSYAALAWVLTAPLGWPAAAASAFSYALCSFGSFLSHRFFTFRSKAPAQGEFFRYCLTTAVGYGLAIVLPLALTQGMRLDPRIAIALVCLTTSSLNYVLLQIYVFKRRDHAA